MIHRVKLIALALLLSGCVSSPAPVTHLQLSDGSSRTGEAPTPTVFVATVELPDFLLRDALMLRSGDYEVEYSSSQRWSEPLDLGIRRVLARRLSQALDSNGVSSAPGTQATWTVRLRVDRFSAQGDTVSLTGDVRLVLRDGEDDGETRLPVALREPLASDDGTDVAAAMSRLLWRLADDIAVAIRAGQDRPVSATRETVRQRGLATALPKQPTLSI